METHIMYTNYKTIFKVKIVLAIFLLNHSALFAADPAFNHSKYDLMKSEFLDMETDFISIIDFSSITDSELNSFLNDESANTHGFRVREFSTVDKYQAYGAKHICKNKYDETSICWYSTGGSIGGVQGHIQSQGVCGQPIGDVDGDIDNAINSPNICETQVTWSGVQFWLNAFDNRDYVADAFPGGNNHPVNRLCYELEFPSNNLVYKWEKPNENPENKHLQLVNPEDTHPNIRELRFEWGTYLAPVNRENGETYDEEVGGTYQKGGSHFYHKPSDYNSIPTDRIYALDQDTIVACISSIPTGVRQGMRPTYAANPLLTMGHNDLNGITNAGSYFNYLTRIYFRLGGRYTTATYPFDIKINKIWMMYEHDNLILASGSGSKMTQKMVNFGNTTTHSTTLTNFVNESRSYRLWMSYGGILPLNGPSDAVKFFIDNNKNGIVDQTDTEYNALDVISIPANSKLDILIEHTPDFASTAVSPIPRWDRNFSHVTISLVELDRLRSSSFALRTWELGPGEQINEENFFQSSAYKDADTEWNVYKHWNLEETPDTNIKLIRNYPEFIKLRSVIPKSPTNLRIE
jgi:hypothetical protein